MKNECRFVSEHEITRQDEIDEKLLSKLSPGDFIFKRIYAQRMTQKQDTNDPSKSLVIGKINRKPNFCFLILFAEHGFFAKEVHGHSYKWHYVK